jgi:hypothetical protein
VPHRRRHHGGERSPLVRRNQERAVPAGARCPRAPGHRHNGAGDIFHGAYVYSYLVDPDAEWEQHFKFARAASAHSIQHLGNEASLPTLAQINETAARFGERRQTPVELGLVPERDKRATKPATVRR